MARQFSATPRTVMAAYRELEAEGLVTMKPRSGVYLAAAHARDHAVLPQLAGWVVDVLLQARGRNIRPIEMPDRIQMCLESVRVSTACVGDNHDQMHSLCSELREDYGLDATGLELDALVSFRPSERRMREVDLLVTTPLHGPAVRRTARRLGKPWIVVSLRPEVMRQTTAMLERGDVYFVATDPRFGKTLKRIFGPLGHGRQIRTVIVGRDSMETIPIDAGVFIMRAAREKLSEPIEAREVVYMPRVLSVESARELLSFVVRMNLAAHQAQS